MLSLPMKISMRGSVPPLPLAQFAIERLNISNIFLLCCAWTRNVWKLSKLDGWVAFACVDALGWFTSFLGNFD